MAETAIADAEVQYVTLGIDQTVFAIEVKNVREILDMRPISRVPNGPPFLMGMLDVSGQGVPVIDLRVKLGLPAAETTEHTRFVVLEIETEGHVRLVGLKADRVFEVTSLAERALEPPPDLGVRWRSDYIRCIGRRKGGFVIVLDLDRLLTGEEQAAIGVAA
jgi:purine-binding chemotaxis protein CheW